MSASAPTDTRRPLLLALLALLSAASLAGACRDDTASAPAPPTPPPARAALPEALGRLPAATTAVAALDARALLGPGEAARAADKLLVQLGVAPGLSAELAQLASRLETIVWLEVDTRPPGGSCRLGVAKLMALDPELPRALGASAEEVRPGLRRLCERARAGACLQQARDRGAGMRCLERRPDGAGLARATLLLGELAPELEGLDAPGLAVLPPVGPEAGGSRGVAVGDAPLVDAVARAWAGEGEQLTASPRLEPLLARLDPSAELAVLRVEGPGADVEALAASVEVADEALTVHIWARGDARLEQVLADDLATFVRLLEDSDGAQVAQALGTSPAAWQTIAEAARALLKTVEITPRGPGVAIRATAPVSARTLLRTWLAEAEAADRR